MADLSKVMEREQLCSEHAAQCFLEAKRRTKKELRMKSLISDKQIEAINCKWRCGGNGHFDWANEIEAVVRAEAEARIELARRAMVAFTPAIDSVLWIAIMWNDHNFDADTIRAKAQRAKDALGLLRDGSLLPESEERERLFALWNAALAALTPNAELWGRRSAASSGPTRAPGSTAETTEVEQ